MSEFVMKSEVSSRPPEPTPTYGFAEGTGFEPYHSGNFDKRISLPSAQVERNEQSGIYPNTRDVFANSFANAFSDRLVAPGIISQATKFDSQGAVTEITNSLGVRWERRASADEGGYEWVAENLPGVHGNFVGNVKQDANGALSIETKKDTFSINKDGSYVHAYKRGAVDSWDPKTLTVKSGMPGGPQVEIRYKEGVGNKLTAVEVDDVKSVNGKPQVVPREAIDEWGYHHSLHKTEQVRQNGKEQLQHPAGKLDLKGNGARHFQPDSITDPGTQFHYLKPEVQNAQPKPYYVNKPLYTPGQALQPEA
jgi:hypothetical protein